MLWILLFGISLSASPLLFLNSIPNMAGRQLLQGRTPRISATRSPLPGGVGRAGHLPSPAVGAAACSVGQMGHLRCVFTKPDIGDSIQSASTQRGAGPACEGFVHSSSRALPSSHSRSPAALPPPTNFPSREPPTSSSSASTRCAPTISVPMGVTDRSLHTSMSSPGRASASPPPTRPPPSRCHRSPPSSPAAIPRTSAFGAMRRLCLAMSPLWRRACASGAGARERP